jgi:hypothetical protein
VLSSSCLASCIGLHHENKQQLSHVDVLTSTVDHTQQQVSPRLSCDDFKHWCCYQSSASLTLMKGMLPVAVLITHAVLSSADFARCPVLSSVLQG